jgi:hypothetical protein
LDEIPTELFKTALKLLREEKTIESAATFRMALESCLKDIQRITNPNIKRKKDEQLFISKLNRELLSEKIYNERWSQKLTRFTKQIGNEAVHVTRKITLKELEETKDMLENFFLAVYFPIKQSTLKNRAKFRRDCLLLENNIFDKIVEKSTENSLKVRNFNENFYINTQIDEFLLAKIVNQHPESLKIQRIQLENEFLEYKKNLIFLSDEIIKANLETKRSENSLYKKPDCIPLEPIFLIFNMLLDLSMIFEIHNEGLTKQTLKQIINIEYHSTNVISHKIDFKTDFQQLKLGITKLILKDDSSYFLSIINEINNFMIYAQISQFKESLNNFITDFERFIFYKLNKHGFFIEGKAGTGKSYYFINLLRNLTNREKGFPYVYLRGIDFNKHEPLIKQILSLLDCTESNFTKIIERLILYGIYSQCSIPFIIDGLNEAERFSVWKEIRTITKSMESKWITPIFSSRPLINSNYRNKILKDLDLIKFDNHIDENKLINSYSEYFNITIDTDHRLHVTPFIAYISCDMAKRNNQKYLFLTNLSLIDILRCSFRELEDKYIERTNSIPKKFWVNDTLEKIAEIIIKTRQTTVSKQLSIELSNNQPKTWDNSVIKFLIEEEVILSDEDNINFSSQIFQDYIVANYLSRQRLNIKEIIELLEIDVSWIDDIIGNYLIINSIMLDSNDLNLLTKIKLILTGKYNHLKGKFTFLNANTFPYLEHFDDKQIKIIEGVYTQNPSFRKDIIDKLIRYGLTKPNQTRTFLLIENLLKSINMIERDLLFGESLRENPIVYLKVISQLEYLGDPQIAKNLMTLLKWFLTSNVERIRYVSTKQLVQLGRKSPSSFIDVFFDSIIVDDHYIIEGMVSSLLGVLTTQREELKPEYNRINNLILDKIFQTGKYEHLMVRDYAFQILSLINESEPDPALFSNVSRELMANKTCLKEKDMKRYINLLGFKYSAHSVEFPMLLLSKISENLGKEFPNENITICQLWQYLNEIGYDFWNTGMVDNSIDPLNFLNSIKTEKGDRLEIEKWAHKYCKIAYNILAAKRIGKVQADKVRRYLSLIQFRDYDVSFPEMEKINDNFPFFEELSSKWIEKCNYCCILGNSNLINNEWILIEMFYSKKIRIRTTNNYVYQYYIQIETNSELLTNPRMDDINLNAFSDSIAIPNIYSPEFPYELLLKHPSIDNKLAWSIRWNSLRGFGINPKNNTKTIIYQPVPHMVSKFNLHRIKGKYDWRDKKGIAITCRTIESDKGQVFSGFFIRKDLLQKFLDSKTITILTTCTKGFMRLDKEIDKHKFHYHYEIGKLDIDFNYLGHCCYHAREKILQLIHESTQNYVKSRIKNR